VISLIAEGCSKKDIIRGLHEAISKMVFTMTGKLRMEKPVIMTRVSRRTGGLLRR
jgi:activator of 2-hydroxyglutaryl-CoA dehydratase